MKISKKLPQFDTDSVLLVVVSKQVGKFYLAGKGFINLVEEFEFNKPEYTDREGYFEHSNRMGTFKSGSVYEPKKQRIKQQTANELFKNMDNLQKNCEYSSVYIFAPEHLKNLLQDSLPKTSKYKVKMTIYGNYGNEHPFELLEMLNNRIRDEKNVVIPTKEDALKILKRRDT
ncbi:MAG: hypothetical protein P1P90_05320 [Patescibacteria group bacterium]|nr:hypothetical protein [Patescibacteria group bacterium]